MQFKTLAFSAFAATALAQQSSVDTLSILQVLQTALPSSLIAEASTNPAAVSSEIGSQFAAGATPSWFSALPSDVQTYLVPVVTGGPLGGGNGTASNGTVIGGNNSTSNSTASTTSTRSRASITSTDGSSSETGGSGSGSQSTGAGFQGSSSSESGNAAAPTAIIGAGLAGAVGLVGLLAL